MTVGLILNFVFKVSDAFIILQALYMTNGRQLWSSHPASTSVNS